MIENKVEKLEFKSWGELSKLKYNQLKDNSNRDVKRLKKSIKERGFFSPFYLWNDFVFDGTGRKQAIEQLIKEGETIPDLPVLKVKANNLAEAKIYALQMSSKHGDITQESLYEFTVDIPEVETLIDEVNFYEFDMEFGETPDYSVLDEDTDVDSDIAEMEGGVKKSIQIEFTPDDYNRAYELCQYARGKQIYIGEHLIGLLEKIKSEYEDN